MYMDESRASYAIYNKSKYQSLELYDIFIKYQDLKYRDFIADVKGEFKHEIEVEKIKYLIKFIRKNVSPSKGLEMYEIWCRIVTEMYSEEKNKIKSKTLK